jgi:ATP/maltotriose-dependent transcriptional regulator MalT
VVIVRSFLEGVLSEVSTWGLADALNTEVDKVNYRIQINLIITKDINHKKHVTKNNGDTSFHYVATTSVDSQQHIKDILLKKKIVGLTKLLTDREVGVLKELQQTRNTKKAASNLNISSRTFANHRFNITKKLGMPGLEAADFVYECSSVEMFTAMLGDFVN